jgi:hypothetical protein
MSDHSEDQLGMVERLFAFLQGELPEGCKIAKSHLPKLTPDQAWTVIWHLGNLFWQVPDHIDRCDVCGNPYDTWRSGDCLDYGKGPYSFCDSCINSEEYVRKMRRNPDKDARKEFFAR